MAGRFSLIFILSAVIIPALFSQDKSLEYTINRKGDIVGHIFFTQSSLADKTTLRLESNVKTWFIFTFFANALEEAVFENDIMIRSSIYRQLNGKEKVNKTTTLNGSNYIVQKGSKQEVLNNDPIRYTLLNMYVLEPKNISKVYSDNFQQLFDIQKVGDQHYKVNFPDRNYTEYFYKNGVCVKVHVHHTLYEVTIELKR
ncbi:MAG TPA: DUF6134 family protein [Saprospiraceae bacterium]|nr:DUF6134 family protein [Saprospiraceae bacterium]